MKGNACNVETIQIKAGVPQESLFRCIKFPAGALSQREVSLSALPKNIEPKETPNTRINVIEMDELYSFVERKKQILRDNAGQ